MSRKGNIEDLSSEELNKAGRVTVALGGFLILMGILFTAILTMGDRNSILWQNDVILKILMIIGVLDIIAGILLARR